MELAWCLGVAIGPICASFLYYIGGYSLPFYFCGSAIFLCIPSIYNLQLPDETEITDEPQFMKAIFDFVKI